MNHISTDIYKNNLDHLLITKFLWTIFRKLATFLWKLGNFL